MSLAIYRWEWSKFPWAWAVEVQPQYRVMLAQELTEHFVGFRPRVDLSTMGRGLAHGGMAISLPRSGVKCPLGLVLHEVAHLAAHAKGSRGHDGTFKAQLIRVHVETRVMKLLPPIMERVRATLASNRRAYDRVVLRESAKAFRKAQVSAHRKTRGYKMELLRARVARLTTKSKRLATLLKKAHRSLAAMERFERVAQATAKSVTTGGSAE